MSYYILATQIRKQIQNIDIISNYMAGLKLPFASVPPSIFRLQVNKELKQEQT